MSFSMSKATLPAFEVGLNALSGVLDKGAAYAAAKKIDPTVLVQSRLAPDMFPLSRQVQIACDMAKNGSARLAGVDPPPFEDKEATNKGHMKGDDYLNHFMLPNFYFHCTAAYAILRHCGVDVGKQDFLGAIPMKMT